jgi:hypothetical protein
VGAILECALKLDGKRYSGKALLETEYLEFRGDARLKLPFTVIRRAMVKDGALRIAFEDREAVFELGAAAEKWLHKILHPKGLIDKLGVKPDQAVVVLGVEDQKFLADLRAVVASLGSRLKAACDVIFLGAETASDLTHLASCRSSIQKDGAIWVVYPKGVKEITEAQVLAAGKKAGLVDVKVVKFSETHTAHKFVIPKAKR